MNETASTQSGSDCYCGWFNPSTGESGTFQSDCRTLIKNPWYHFATKAWSRYKARASWMRQEKEHEARRAKLQADFEADRRRREEEAWTYHKTTTVEINWWGVSLFGPTETWQTHEQRAIYYNHLLKAAKFQDGTKLDYNALCKDGSVVIL